MLVHIKAFVAGFVSTLLFHQGLLQLLYVRRCIPARRMEPGAGAAAGRARQ